MGKFRLTELSANDTIILGYFSLTFLLHQQFSCFYFYFFFFIYIFCTNFRPFMEVISYRLMFDEAN